jgi:hypothetical protein
MLDDFGESKVTVKKSMLLEKLRANREAHVLSFQEAREGYILRLQEHFQKQTQAIGAVVAQLPSPSNEALESVQLNVTFPAPICRSKDYDLAIKMLEWSVADEVQISQSQFQQFVQDDWSWSGQVGATNSLYSNSRRK